MDDDPSFCSSCDDLSMHKGLSIFFGLCSGITGILALTLNDKSQCAQSYDTLRVIGIGLIVFSICFFVHGLFVLHGFLWLVGPSEIFVFVWDCMLIDEVVRGNESEDCSGGRGTLRLFIIGWMAPLLLVQTLPLLAYGPNEASMTTFYHGPQYAEFQTLVS